LKKGGTWHKGQLTRRGEKIPFQKYSSYRAEKKTFSKEKRGTGFCRRKGGGRRIGRVFFHKITEGKSNKARKKKKRGERNQQATREEQRAIQTEGGC